MKMLIRRDKLRVVAVGYDWPVPGTNTIASKVLYVYEHLAVRLRASRLGTLVMTIFTGSALERRNLRHHKLGKPSVPEENIRFAHGESRGKGVPCQSWSQKDGTGCAIVKHPSPEYSVGLAVMRCTGKACDPDSKDHVPCLMVPKKQTNRLALPHIHRSGENIIRHSPVTS